METVTDLAAALSLWFLLHTHQDNGRGKHYKMKTINHNTPSLSLLLLIY